MNLVGLVLAELGDGGCARDQARQPFFELAPVTDGTRQTDRQHTQIKPRRGDGEEGKTERGISGVDIVLTERVRRAVAVHERVARAHAAVRAGEQACARQPCPALTPAHAPNQKYMWIQLVASIHPVTSLRNAVAWPTSQSPPPHHLVIAPDGSGGPVFEKSSPVAKEQQSAQVA